jgi:hypothetical protein
MDLKQVSDWDLITELRTRGYALAIWCIEDVIHTGLQRHPPLDITEEEASDVLSYVDSKHDANYGITWDTLDYAIDMMLEDKEFNFINPKKMRVFRVDYLDENGDQKQAYFDDSAGEIKSGEDAKEAQQAEDKRFIILGVKEI